MSKQCQYHHNFEQTTEECQALKDKIEEVVQIGNLYRFVQTTKKSLYRSPLRERYPSKEKYPQHGQDRSRCSENDRRPTKQQRRSESLKQGGRPQS